jgi:hypothetical protein
MLVTWKCTCGARTLNHLEWCGACGRGRPPPPPVAAPSNTPSIKDDLMPKE